MTLANSLVVRLTGLSEAIPLNHLRIVHHIASTLIFRKTQGMTYLGDAMKSPIDNIYELNGSKFLKTLKEDLKTWINLPLSLWGRAEVIKRNVLPRLSFPISAIPVKFHHQ